MRTNGSRNWGKSNFTPSQKDLATKAMASNGLFRNTTLGNMYHSLNAAGKQELMTGLMNNTYGGLNDILKNAGMKVSDLTYDNKGINFTATGKKWHQENCSIAEASGKRRRRYINRSPRHEWKNEFISTCRVDGMI